MIPVLSVLDPVAARAQLARVFGFVPAENGRMSLGDQQVLVVRAGEAPEGLIALRLDHIALATADADKTRARFEERGATLAAAFTPDGPKDIPEFWENGVRFVFFEGPDGWPMEFCARTGTPCTEGHSHYGIRTADIGAAEAALLALDAKPIARHVLAGETGPVHVLFFARAGQVFEVFDEGPFPKPQGSHGWVGLLAA